ncbi:hypothetical protein [Streptomyces sp. NPDC101234]
MAVGNLLHPVDTTALDGKHVAHQVVDHLYGKRQPTDGVRLTADEPFLE